MWREIERLAERGADDDPAHDALPRGGRPARLAAGDRRPRPHRRRRARRRQLKSDLRGRRRRRSSSPTARARTHAPRSQRVEGLGEVELDGRVVRARARDGAAAIPRVLAALERDGRHGRVGDAVAPVARRRLPAPRRPRVPPRRARARRARGGGGVTPLRQTWQVTLRGVRVLIRQPAYLGDHADAADHLAAAVRRAVQGGRADPGLPRRLLHRLPDAGHRRDARGLLGRLDGHGLHRRHRRRRDGPRCSSRRCGAAR